MGRRTDGRTDDAVAPFRCSLARAHASPCKRRGRTRTTAMPRAAASQMATATTVTASAAAGAMAAAAAAAKAADNGRGARCAQSATARPLHRHRAAPRPVPPGRAAPSDAWPDPRSVHPIQSFPRSALSGSRRLCALVRTNHQDPAPQMTDRTWHCDSALPAPLRLPCSGVADGPAGIASHRRRPLALAPFSADHRGWMHHRGAVGCTEAAVAFDEPHAAVFVVAGSCTAWWCGV